ncbi:cell division protein FtsI [Curvibacter sp. HBC61]|uniref:Cell division protein FtsI n=1 Tax=Curvibacter cyanobacteriorum TaxID=3026422 RepID=A0ABT5N188_9BURK|nr:cell division protein FtsI [Curvibacter sp. HBC61]MDD0840076.1 cell division protein FtsI [Curvibacter sp. HBC61]
MTVPPCAPLTRPSTALRALATLGLGAALSGCSIVSPLPLWELTKAAGAATGSALQVSKGQASDTIYHLHPAVKAVCIEYNPQTQVPDVVPALQAELRHHSVESRVYSSNAWSDRCPVWLRYSAYIDWATPPFSDQHKPYLNRASLTLQRDNGQVLSTSHYNVDSSFSAGKWGSTRDKLGPVVTALLTGFEN